jgi:hypothetical protein
LQINTHPDNQFTFLKNQSIEGCEIRVNQPGSLPLPNQFYVISVAAQRWYVYEYSVNAVIRSNTLHLDLRGYMINSECKQAIKMVLMNIMPVSQYRGELTQQPTSRPTPRPTLENSYCPGTPPSRVRVGDHVLIITEGIWLRSEPRAADETRLAQ